MTTSPSHDTTLAFLRGIEFHQKGHLLEAEQIYKDVLSQFPAHAGSLHMLGLLAYQSGNFEEAVDLISQAIAENATEAKLYADRGVAFRKLKKFNLALEDYQRALELAPNFFQAYVYKGNLFKELGQFDQSVENYEQAISLNPNDPRVQLSLANTLQALERHEEAAKCFQKVVQLTPNDSSAYNNWGVSLRALKQLESAIECFEKAIAIDPKAYASHNNLGLTYHDMKGFEQAITSYQRAISVNEKYDRAHNNLGQAYLALGDASKAVKHLTRALEIQTLPETYVNRANAWLELSQFDRAFEDFQAALKIDSEFKLAHLNRSMLRLLLGQYETAWEEYEWRLKSSNAFNKVHLQKKTKWHGHENLTGKTILLTREQGFGDTLQFCRYVSMVKKLGAKVLLEVQKPLVSLLKNLEDVDVVYADGEVSEPFDYYIFLMSLPLAFETRVNNIPKPVAYLSSTEPLKQKWHQILGESLKKRVGLVFTGSPTHQNDYNRSIEFKKLLPYLPKCLDYICLQKELRDKDKEQLLHEGIPFFGDKMDDFHDTAALVELMDLVISVDTSVAHLSGALGKPTWVMLPATPDWRWMLNRSDSPWYPNVKLYRQGQDKNWRQVFKQVGADLETYFELPAVKEQIELGLDSFDHALMLHQKGELQAAKQIYEQLLAKNPQHIQALHFFGVLAYQTQNASLAVSLIEKAIALNPAYAEAHCHLGLALQALLLPERALESFDKAIELQANFAQAHNNKGYALQQLGRYELAVKSFENAIQIDETFAGAHFNQGNAYKSMGNLVGALQSYNKAIEIEPQYAEAFNNRGVVLKELKKLEMAVLSFEKASHIKPQYAEAYNNCGNTLRELKRYEEAIASFDCALSVRPQFAEAHNNKGFALNEMSQFESAICSFDAAIAIKPDYADAHGNRGNSFKKLQRYTEAIESYDKALKIKPDYAEAFYNKGVVLTELLQLQEAQECYDRAIAMDDSSPIVFRNRAMVRLMLGQFEQGWQDFEWRWQQPEMAEKRRHFSQPLWLGNESLQNKTIFIYAEQGLGDSIQFCRYTKLLAEQGAKVILEVPQTLHRIFESLEGVTKIVTSYQEAGDFDFQCPLMSLPLAFKTRLSTIPLSSPYLISNENLRNGWQNKLGPKVKPRIGLVWSGSTGHGNDPNRSIKLSQLVEKLPTNCQYISLQKEIRQIDQAALTQSAIQYFGDELSDFAETAALCDLMDIVVSVDTSVAHLSAALGRETWILLPYVPDWRWLVNTNKSPWYESVKLLRQQADRSWEVVIDRLSKELTRI